MPTMYFLCVHMSEQERESINPPPIQHFLEFPLLLTSSFSPDYKCSWKETYLKSKYLLLTTNRFTLGTLKRILRCNNQVLLFERWIFILGGNHKLSNGHHKPNKWRARGPTFKYLHDSITKVSTVKDVWVSWVFSKGFSPVKNSIIILLSISFQHTAPN